MLHLLYKVCVYKHRWPRQDKGHPWVFAWGHNILGKITLLQCQANMQLKSAVCWTGSWAYVNKAHVKTINKKHIAFGSVQNARPWKKHIMAHKLSIDVILHDNWPSLLLFHTDYQEYGYDNAQKYYCSVLPWDWTGNAKHSSSSRKITEISYNTRTWTYCNMLIKL